eukprot:gene17853-biopygen25707
MPPATSLSAAALLCALPHAAGDQECFSCRKPKNCKGISCMIVGGCGKGVPAGYYPDLSKCNSYC